MDVFFFEIDSGRAMTVVGIKGEGETCLPTVVLDVNREKKNGPIQKSRCVTPLFSGAQEIILWNATRLNMAIILQVHNHNIDEDP